MLSAVSNISSSQNFKILALTLQLIFLDFSQLFLKGSMIFQFFSFKMMARFPHCQCIHKPKKRTAAT